MLLGRREARELVVGARQLENKKPRTNGYDLRAHAWHVRVAVPSLTSGAAATT